MSEQPAAPVQRRKPRTAPTFTFNPQLLLSLALATALIVIGVFLVWQGSLQWRTAADLEKAQQAAHTQATRWSEQITSLNEKASAALAADPVRLALARGEPGWPKAQTAMAALLPDGAEVEFFSPTLREVLARGDIRELGYARAALLMQAQSLGADAPAHLRVEGQGQDGARLWLPRAVRDDSQLLAYALVSVPAVALLRDFRAAASGSARLDMRQGEGRDNVLFSNRGNPGSSVGDAGVSVAGSTLRIAVAPPEPFVVVPFSMTISLLLAALCLIAGAGTLWLRHAGTQAALALLRRPARGASLQEELTLTDTLAHDDAHFNDGSDEPDTAAAATPDDAGDGIAELDAAIFRAYDIRGIVGKGLSSAVARQIGLAIGSEARERGLDEIVVGRDGRLSGPELSAALISGLRATGMDVIDIGPAATPLVYFACYHLNTGSGVAITGSHNPADYNGFKIVLGGETLAEQAIQDLHARIVEQRFTSGEGGLQQMDINTDYINRIADDVQLQAPLKVVVDCGNGIPGAVAPAVLEAIGCQVTELYCDVDGTFPNHHPDPSNPENLQDLIFSVKQTGADLGLAFDGDGDRLGVVTPQGEIIFADRVLMLFAMDVLTRNPGATIIYDVKCTGHLQSLILQHGGSPLMWKTGHSLIKSKMIETGAELAGEMSGHFFFKERWYGFDDAIYAAARLLEIIASDPLERGAQALFDELPNGVSTPELNVAMQEGENHPFIDRFRAAAKFEGARLTTIDGLRVDWPDGWGLVRASNTTPVLVLRFDADNAEALGRIKDVFREQLLAVESSLALPF